MAARVSGTPAVSNADGIATVSAWIMGRRQGPNALVATTGSVAPVTFTAMSVFQFAERLVSDPSPSANEFDGDSLGIAIRVTSQSQIATVRAVVAGVSTSLTASTGNVWQGVLPLQSVPLDTQQLTVTATDINGAATNAVTPFVHYAVGSASPVSVATVPGTCSTTGPDAFCIGGTRRTAHSSSDRLAALKRCSAPIHSRGGAEHPPARRYYLTAVGAIALARQSQDAGARILYEWRNGAVTTVVGTVSLDVNANYAAFDTFDGNTIRLYRRDLATGADVLVLGLPVNVELPGSVAPNGDVVFSYSSVYRYRAGQLTAIASPLSVSPVTDGVNVVYRVCCAIGKIALYDGTGETVLVDNPSSNNVSSIVYALNGGWTAFHEAGDWTVAALAALAHRAAPPTVGCGERGEDRRNRHRRHGGIHLGRHAVCHHGYRNAYRRRLRAGTSRVAR